MNVGNSTPYSEFTYRQSMILDALSSGFNDSDPARNYFASLL